MQKTKKLILRYRPPHSFYPEEDKTHPYIVVKVQHTTDYNPGDGLTKEVVDSLNVSRHWDVTVVAS